MRGAWGSSPRITHHASHITQLILPLLRLKPRDHHRLVTHLDAAGGAVGQGVLEPFLIVALWVVLAQVRAAALSACDSTLDNRLSAIEQVAQLERLEQVSIEDL